MCWPGPKHCPPNNYLTYAGGAGPKLGSPRLLLQRLSSSNKWRLNMKPSTTRFSLSSQLVIVVLAIIGIISFILFWSATPGHALPEYANRTGEPCATCHVSPGGGGPRTLRGLLWASRGKPDK